MGAQNIFCDVCKWSKKLKKSERMAEGVREDVGGKLWQANGFAVRYNVHRQVKWKKNKQRCQTKRKRAIANLCKPNKKRKKKQP